MERPTCKTCPHFRDFGTDGTCHKSAPPPVQDFGQFDSPSRQGRRTIWAVVERDNGCGDHPEFPAYIASLKPRPGVPEYLLINNDLDGTKADLAREIIRTTAPDHDALARIGRDILSTVSTPDPASPSGTDTTMGTSPADTPRRS